jgi:hypothetical protein
VGRNVWVYAPLCMEERMWGCYSRYDVRDEVKHGRDTVYGKSEELSLSFKSRGREKRISRDHDEHNSCLRLDPYARLLVHSHIAYRDLKSPSITGD